MPIEVYYYNRNESLLSKSQIDYVQLNPGTPYNGYSTMKQAILYEESTGTKAGRYYRTRFVQTDSSDDTVNVCATNTLSLKDGILVYSSDRNTLIVDVNKKAYYTPIYQSGVYLKKDVQIIRDVIESPLGLLFKYTIIY